MDVREWKETDRRQYLRILPLPLLPCSCPGDICDCSHRVRSCEVPVESSPHLSRLYAFLISCSEADFETGEAASVRDMLDRRVARLQTNALGFCTDQQHGREEPKAEQQQRRDMPETPCLRGEEVEEGEWVAARLRTLILCFPNLDTDT